MPRWTRVFVVMKERTHELFFSARGSVRAALVIIVLLTLVALTSQWWLPYDPQAIDLPSVCCHLTASIGWGPTILAAIFSPVCWRRPGCHWGR